MNRRTVPFLEPDVEFRYNLSRLLTELHYATSQVTIIKDGRNFPYYQRMIQIWNNKDTVCYFETFRGKDIKAPIKWPTLFQQ